MLGNVVVIKRDKKHAKLKTYEDSSLTIIQKLYKQKVASCYVHNL